MSVECYGIFRRPGVRSYEGIMNSKKVRKYVCMCIFIYVYMYVWWLPPPRSCWTEGRIGTGESELSKESTFLGTCMHVCRQLNIFMHVCMYVCMYIEGTYRGPESRP